MFHLFAGYEYYANPSLGDYIGVFDTVEKAKDALFGVPHEWYTIVVIDPETKELKNYKVEGECYGAFDSDY